MALEMRQNLRLQMSLQLRMTPQLQQAIKLLQLTRMELVKQVQQELVDNPMLEEGLEEQGGQATQRSGDMGLEGVEHEHRPPESAPPATRTAEVKGDGQAVKEIDWDAYLEHHTLSPPMPSRQAAAPDELASREVLLTRGPSLAEHLQRQMNIHPVSDAEQRIGQLIIGNLDPNGYLLEPTIDELAHEARVPLELATKTLEWIQTFDPIGVAARSLAECLMIQAEAAGEDDAVVVGIIAEHLDDLARRNYAAIARELHQPVEEIYEAVKVLRAFDPKPARQYSLEEPVYITPDVYIHKVGDEYFVVGNDDGLPKLRIAGFYRTALRGDADARRYVQEKMRAAQWLIRSIQQRQRTIIRVTESILKFQRGFFDHGFSHLKPLILRDVAEDISMHESTISRVTSNKYVHTPRGIFELKFFFNAGITRTKGEDIASESVKRTLAALIAGEDAKKPYSDQKLVTLLRADTIEIARRTVAKYREQLGILSSSQRKKVF